jgi:hypothetical protein
VVQAGFEPEYPAECAVFFAQFRRTSTSENLFANDSAPLVVRDMAPREAVIANAQGAGLLVASEQRFEPQFRTAV